MLRVKGLKGENRTETLENYSLAGVILGTIIFSIGIGLTIISTKGISVIIMMLGALLSFISSVAVVGVLFFKEVLRKG